MERTATVATMRTLLALGTGQAQAATQTFAQEEDIIWELGPADPYPSSIPVAGVSGTVTKVTVGFTDLDNTDETDDLSFMLQGPGGQTVRLMNGAGGMGGAFNVNLIFELGRRRSFGVPGACQGRVQAHRQPARRLHGGPGTPPPYGQALSTFDGVDANGDWRLFMVDYEIPGNGSLKAWSLNITTEADPDPPGPDPEKLTLELDASKQKLARRLALDVDAGAAGELVFTGKARGSVDVGRAPARSTRGSIPGPSRSSSGS